MPYDTEYLDEDGGVITTYWGRISDEDVIKSGKEKLASLEKLKTYRYALTDLSLVKTFDLTSKGIQTNAEIASKIFKENNQFIVAFVLPTDAEYGMGRMWQVYGDQYGIKSFVCRTRAEAEEWIRTNLTQDDAMNEKVNRRSVLQNKKNDTGETDKTMAAVCGLYCEACNLYIGTKEDPKRLKNIAALFQVTEEEAKCYGCRAEKRGPYCTICKMVPCAKDRGIDFCVQCEDYPCEDLKRFQSEMPHRIELWEDLEQIKAVGYERWLKNVREKYTCRECGAVNSAYDATCRKCGNEPGCDYVEKHKHAVEAFLKGTIEIR